MTEHTENKVNLAFVRYIERRVKTLAIYNDLTYEVALSRERRSATSDLLDGHIGYDLKSGEYVQPEVCGSTCIRCRRDS